MRYRRVFLIFPSYQASVFSNGAYLDAGLGYISEALSASGIENRVFDMSLHKNRNKLFTKIQKFNPDLIGIAMRTLNFKSHYTLVTELKKTFPQVHIVAGGPHISTVKEKALLDCVELDYGVVLEGEWTIVELCKAEMPVSEIQGLIFRAPNGEVTYNSERPFCKDLDTLPFPTYSQFELNKYKCIPIVSSRGCPYQCIYCPVKVTIGRQYRARNPIFVADEVEWWYKRGWRNFEFTDDNFTLIKQRAYQFCEEIARRDLKNVMFSCGNGIRADRVDYKLLKKMKEVGFWQLSFGVEAGNNRILRNIKKGETLKEIEQAIAWACELGFMVKLTFLIGSPGETWKDIQDSIRVALKYPVWKFNFFNLVPFPGTELFNWITKHDYWLVNPGEYLNQTSKWTNEPAFQTPELSRQERIKAFEITHDIMTTHWSKSERKSRRLILRKRLEAKGLPTPFAIFLAGLRYNNLMPAIDKRLPWLSHIMRNMTSFIRTSLDSTR